MFTIQIGKEYKMIFREGPLLYKVGHLNKYFYFSSSGEWQLSNNQDEIDRAFKMSQKKEANTKISKAAIQRLLI